MTQRAEFDKIELFLIRVLHTLITERSVSRAALRLHSTQPAVSAQLKRLRQLTGDPLLVRAGNEMTPTETALQLVGPASNLLHEAERLFSKRTRTSGFDVAGSDAMFRVAASDYLDPLFLPMLVARIKQLAPLCRIEIHGLSPDSDYHGHLSLGQVDLVIGNWLKPPEDLHMARLFDDDLVSLVNADHPAVRRPWDVDTWLQAEHIAPTPMHPGARGIIDQMLDDMGLQRNISARCAHFSLIPDMVASSLLVLTTGRQYCERYTERLPLAILPCPVAFPPLTYYQLWHARTHQSAAAAWLREGVRAVAQSLQKQ